MELHLNQEQPIFQQIADMLENAILSGAYPEESQIPSTTELAVALRINPATALKGVSLLTDAGLLYKKRGLGMFVRSGARKQLSQLRHAQFERDFIQPLIHEARRIGIDRSQIQHMLERGYQNHDE